MSCSLSLRVLIDVLCSSLRLLPLSLHLFNLLIHFRLSFILSLLFLIAFIPRLSLFCCHPLSFFFSLLIHLFLFHFPFLLNFTCSFVYLFLVHDSLFIFFSYFLHPPSFTSSAFLLQFILFITSFSPPNFSLLPIPFPLSLISSFLSSLIILPASSPPFHSLSQFPHFLILFFPNYPFYFIYSFPYFLFIPSFSSTFPSLIIF